MIVKHNRNCDHGNPQKKQQKTLDMLSLYLLFGMFCEVFYRKNDRRVIM